MNKPVLHWSYRDYREIPEDLLEFEEFLQEIYLKENFITIIPNWLLQLINLRFIQLSGNSIKELPSDINKLENLEFLDVSHNKLTALPSTIGYLGNLQRFNVSGNEISIIPNTIGQLKKLETIDLSSNLIRRIPRELGNCSSLDEIVLNDNILLQMLPNNVTNLAKLDTFCADRCGLLYLPAILSDSVTLLRIFNNNHVTHVPMIYKKYIRRYYDVIRPIPPKFPCNGKLMIVEEIDSKRQLLLPFFTRRVYSHEQRKVFSLFDLCLQTLDESKIDKDCYDLVPTTVQDYLHNCPVAICAGEDCKKLLQTEYYFLIVRRINSSSGLILTCSFCSVECTKAWIETNASNYYFVKWRIFNN